MHVLTRFSLRRVPVIILLMVFVVLGGLYSSQQLKSELLPNIDLPVISVVTIYAGAAPDDVRRDVTEPIEKAIAGTVNLKTVTSTSNDSLAFVSAEYEYGTDMEKTQKAVEDAVSALTFPAQVQRPTVGRFSFQDIPVIAYTVNTQDTSADALVNLRRAITDKLVPDLKALNGVNSVSVAGGGVKEVQITFNQPALDKKGIQASTVTQLLQANNISFPTGDIVNNGQSIPVRVENEFTTLDDLRNLVVRPEIPAGATGATGASGASGAGAPSGAGGAPSGQPGASTGATGATGATRPITGTTGAASGTQQGSTGTTGAAGGGSTTGTGSATGGAAKPAATAIPAVKLSDIASVNLSNASNDSISRSNGKPSLSLIIYKTQNANTVQVSDAVTAKMDELKSAISGSQTVVLFDQSTFIKDSLNGLIREGLLGAVLAIAVILLFLVSIRSTIVTAVSIPLSVLIALILLNVFNVSLNIMSLAGLAVAIGRVVDDSIVVLENIYRHHFQNGESLKDAAFNGTKEVATAITASTITTVCVFLPLGFIAGLVSEFFRPFAVAVSVSLLASLVVALTIIPVLAAQLLKSGKATY
jgi:HAE1 family hydrophobic/amphiphilic exporter-1